MKIRRSLTLDAANSIANESIKQGRDIGIDAICVVVLDSGGIPVALQSQDGCGILRFDVALGKAYGALGMGTSGRDLSQRLAARPNFASALSALSDGRFVPNAGGVLVVDGEGMAIGAVGISGDTSPKDEYCAIRAIQAAGFVSNPLKINPAWRN
jgi:uncharacterized protein GlcG (DUF336 family)